MKTPSLLSNFTALLALSLMANVAFGADKTDVSELMAKGQRAYTGGDFDAAKLDFQAVLQSQPLNQTAAAFLRRIAIAEKNNSGSLEAELQKIILPHVELKEAPLGSAFAYLTQQIVKLSGGKVHPNFVVVLSQDFQNKTTVTLSLESVSVADVINYVADLANIEFKYQQKAILVTKVAAESATTPVSGSSTFTTSSSSSTIAQ